ncbi:MAG: hypothetical protein ACLSVD_04660 [Eggerthellaceae bacterium]
MAWARSRRRHLRAIASRIGEIARKHGGIAGYLGGDDFTLLLPHGLIDEKRVESELEEGAVRFRRTPSGSSPLSECAPSTARTCP